MMDDIRFARFKRLLETWQIDPAFRLEAESGTPGLFPSGEEKVMGEAIHAIVEGRSLQMRQNPYVGSFLERNAKVSRYVEESVHSSSFRSPEVYDYLTRTRNRSQMESRFLRAHTNFYYFPLAVELSRGCRVGCSFCGLMAEKWSENAPYDRELWRGMLRASLNLLGPIAGDGPCYFATEPLDHPDYDLFLADQEEITGRFPQTTTAAADRDPEQTRRLMRLLGEERLRDQHRLRFSIRSLAQFRRICQIFSPEETVHIELLPNNRESIYVLSDSGRSRRTDNPRPRVRYSISCIAGAKVSLTDRTVEFVEPVLPDDTWPCGYRVLETLRFDSAEEYGEKLAALFQRHAPGPLPKDRPIRLHPEVRRIRREGKILLAGDGVAYRIEDNPLNGTILDRLEKGTTVRNLDLETGLSGWTEEALFELLNKMFQRGYLVII